MRKHRIKFTDLALLSVSFIVSCQREIAARPERTAATSTSATINPNAIYSGSHDRYAVQSEVTSLLAGQTFAGFKDGTGRNAQFNAPSDLATDPAGNIYVADVANNRIRKITPDGIVSTIAGTGEAGFQDGYAPGAKLNHPTSLAFGPDGSLYIADQDNNRIRKITGTTITTIAGTGVAGFSDGPGSVARFNAPAGIAVDATGIVYVADKGNNRVRRIATTGIVFQWVGDGTPGFKDGSGALAELNQPWGIAVGSGGAVYVADAGNKRIRKIVSGVISTLAGGDNTLSLPTGVATDAAGNIFAADASNNRIYKITPAGIMTKLVGSGYSSFFDSYDTLAAIEPWGLTIDANGTMYVAERNSEVIRKITPVPAIRTLAGSGVSGYREGKGKLAQFKQPWGVVVDKAGNTYVADYLDNRIRRITPDGTTSLLAGSGTYGHTDGPGSTASFRHPSGLTADAAGNIYVYEENYIRKITPAGLVTTISDNVFSWGELAVDNTGTIYATSNENFIYKIEPDGSTTRIGDLPNFGYADNVLKPRSWYIARTGAGLTVGTFSLDMKYNISNGRDIAGPLWPTPLDGKYNTPYAPVVASMTVDSLGHMYFGMYSGDIIDLTAADNPYIFTYARGDNTNADGPATLYGCNFPRAMTFGPNGALYIADSTAHSIRIMSK